MKIRLDQRSGYSAFERRVLDAVHGFWRDHDHSRLEEIVNELDELMQEETNGQIAGSEQWISIRGWAANRGGLGLRRLRAINPEYRISIERKRRSDVPRRRYSLTRHAGFQIVARGPRNARPFTFELADFLGHGLHFRASNSGASYKLGFFGVDETVAQGEVGQDSPLAYVDDVITSTVFTEDDRATWFSALVHRNPEELFDLIDTDEGARVARAAAEVLGQFPENARWADRFALSAFDETTTFTSDLTAVRVWHPPVTKTPSKMLVPDLVGEGHLVRAVRGTHPMPCPSEEWLRLDSAEVLNGAVIVTDGRMVVYEDAADPRHGFVAGQWDVVFGSRMSPGGAFLHRAPLAGIEVPEGILLAGRNDANWYHWVIEYLPRVLQVDERISPNAPLLVTGRTPETGIELLRSLTTRPIIELDSASTVRVGILHVVAPPVQVLDTTEVPWSAGISMNPGVLRRFRDRVLFGRNDVVPTRRVFLRRNSGHRGLRNESDLASIARRHQLEQIDPGTLTWQQQLELFESTSLLVGASGAVMANYLFMSPGSRILALTSSALRDFVLPAALAEVAGAEFSYLTGPTSTGLQSVRHRREWMHSDFTIDPVLFEQTLIEEIAAVRPVVA
jgi:capsular polysaccharide biosynthesis protein